MNINVKNLKRDLISYFGSAIFMVSPIAMMELARVERATSEELIEIEKENGFDLCNYMLCQILKSMVFSMLFCL